MFWLYLYDHFLKKLISGKYINEVLTVLWKVNTLLLAPPTRKRIRQTSNQAQILIYPPRKLCPLELLHFWVDNYSHLWLMRISKLCLILTRIFHHHCWIPVTVRVYPLISFFIFIFLGKKNLVFLIVLNATAVQDSFEPTLDLDDLQCFLEQFLSLPPWKMVVFLETVNLVFAFPAQVLS